MVIITLGRKKFGFQLKYSMGFWDLAYCQSPWKRAELKALLFTSVCFECCIKKKKERNPKADQPKQHSFAICRKVETFSYTETGTAAAASAKGMLNVKGLYALRWTIANRNKMSQCLDIKINDQMMLHCQRSNFRKESFQVILQALTQYLV